MLSALVLLASAYVGNALIKDQEGTGLVLASQLVINAELLPAYSSEGKETAKVRDMSDKDMSANKIRKKLAKAEGKIIKARHKLQKMEFKVPTWCDVDDDEDRRRKSDADGLFKLMDANVTRGNLKNLVTDKPAPITVALSQGVGAGELMPVFPGAPSVTAPAAYAAEHMVLLAQEIGKAAKRVDRVMDSAGSYSTFITDVAQELSKKKNVGATYKQAKERLNKMFAKRWKKMGPTELMNELLEQAKAHDAVHDRFKKLRKVVKSGRCAEEDEQ
jgi:hypothetical protein